jgi:plastocyanin
MSTTKVSPTGTDMTTPPPRRRHSVLDVVMLVGLFLVVVADGVAQALEGALIPPVVVFQALYLLCGIAVATGRRWAMLLPLVVCPLDIVADFASGFPQYTLTHPSSNVVAFGRFVLEYPLLALVIVASASKLVQTLRREPFHAPRGLSPAVGAVAGLILGAFLIGTIAQAPAAGGSATGQAGSVTVHLTANWFAPDLVALHKGERLLIADDGPVPHTLTNGSWSADNRPVPAVEPGAPLVKNVALNNTTVTLGPFTTPGTYHLYCTIHPGMTLTIVVQ